MTSAQPPAPPRPAPIVPAPRPFPVALVSVALVFAALLVLAAVPLAPVAHAQADGDARTNGDGEDESAAIAALAEHHRVFLEEADLLLSPREREVFLGLERDYRRDTFMERFWRAHDPFPETARNELRETWTARLAEARERYESVAGDRARILLLLGPAESEETFSCPGVIRPVEIWRYSQAGPIASPFTVAFVRRGGADWRLWYPTEGLVSVLAGAMGLSSTEDAVRRIQGSCSRGEAALSEMATALDFGVLEERGVRFLPSPGEEWLGSFLAASTEVPQGARELPGELSFAFPGRNGGRTVIQGVVAVPRDAATPLQTGPHRSYVLTVDGEVLRDGRLFDQFRYRFDFPVDRTPDDALPVIVQRLLRPGSYELVLRVHDRGGDAYLRRQVNLDVPRLEAEMLPAAQTSANEVAGGEPGATATADATTMADGASDRGATPGERDLDDALAEANATLARGDHTLTLIPPPSGLLTGPVRLEARAQGPSIARVRFHLDDQPVMAKTRAPYSVELDLGTAPRLHRVAAVAEARDGTELARDEVMINAGPHRFGVRLVEPRRGGRYERSLRARAVVEVPEGDELDRVELWLDEVLVATLYTPPFVQPLLLDPEDPGPTYVRAVAYLEDGALAEDLVYVNAPEYLEEVDVNLIELYTSVVDRRGRPVEGLERSAFTVYEDGEAQEVQRFELARDLPIHAGVVLDVSTSMDQKLGEAVDAALAFFDTVITPRDRAAVITFNERPRVAARFTNDLEILAGSVAGLQAEGETALHDAVVYGLHYFSGIRGKRVIVLISDGQDVRSRYGFEDTLEYARRTGVAIYTVGVDLAPRDVESRSKLVNLAEETGGRSWFIDRASGLEEVYDSIQEELRSQYLLVYQAEGGDRSRFREVRVEVDADGTEAKTIRGYYPP